LTKRLTVTWACVSIIRRRRSMTITRSRRSIHRLTRRRPMISNLHTGIQFVGVRAAVDPLTKATAPQRNRVVRARIRQSGRGHAGARAEWVPGNSYTTAAVKTAFRFGFAYDLFGDGRRRSAADSACTTTGRWKPGVQHVGPAAADLYAGAVTTARINQIASATGVFGPPASTHGSEIRRWVPWWRISASASSVNCPQHSVGCGLCGESRGDLIGNN